MIARYGNFRTYKIEMIDYTKNPLSTFKNNKKGVEMTYIDYYKEVYGIHVSDLKQPLIYALKNIRKEYEK